MKLYTIGTKKQDNDYKYTVIEPKEAYGTEMPQLYKNHSEAQDVINTTPFNHTFVVVELEVL